MSGSSTQSAVRMYGSAMNTNHGDIRNMVANNEIPKNQKPITLSS